MDVDEEDIFGGQRNPIPLQPPQPPVPPPQPSPLPPQPSQLPPSQLPPPPTPSRRDPARIVNGRRYSNGRPSNAGQLDNKYCSTGRHHRPRINFVEGTREYQTCNDCRARQRRSRANQNATNTAAQQHSPSPPPQPSPPPPQPSLPPPQPSHPPPPQQPDPLLNPAISPEDHNHLERVQEKWNAIKLEICDGCEREWFDLDVQQHSGSNLCKDCRKTVPLFHKDNNLYPGPGCSNLPPLTQMEEMLISPVHALIQVGIWLNYIQQTLTVNIGLAGSWWPT